MDSTAKFSVGVGLGVAILGGVFSYYWIGRTETDQDLTKHEPRIKFDTETIQKHFEKVANNPAFKESAENVKAGKMPTSMISAFAMHPTMLRDFCAGSESIYPGGLIERVLKEKVIVAVSKLNACQF